MTIESTAPRVVQHGDHDHTADITEIRRIIERVETAYNTNDAELMTADFTPDATVVNAVGTRISGRAALLAANRAGLAGFLKDQYVRYDVTDIVFLRPDVALAHKVARATTADGGLIDREPAMIALYVLIRENGRWWTAARQNTLVPHKD
ncbi:SgcJ/EcaC family oxidoreductase [Nocardia farcinica]|uniref:SgcJ/EcaC family oxidoreductase n=1 Tax=Nocardia farcinica TaxID=37329 RepID=UPI0018952B9C|nr:SgcJ/EcaC family oxidoreductase [Nocardia farcinica]MBF6256659.1 SgcJ/EcaC family oxidoreductase [Nocardia farcinica]MBF6440596.1 SgcJ/EcaC family oxidoreductase [Nocardia farcinica]MBF6523917.1 SgcJ/EcaC family oxidoreductase [Nocardia farcinica]